MKFLSNFVLFFFVSSTILNSVPAWGMTDEQSPRSPANPRSAAKRRCKELTTGLAHIENAAKRSAAFFSRESTGPSVEVAEQPTAVTAGENTAVDPYVVTERTDFNERMRATLSATKQPEPEAPADPVAEVVAAPAAITAAPAAEGNISEPSWAERVLIRAAGLFFSTGSEAPVTPPPATSTPASVPATSSTIETHGDDVVVPPLSTRVPLSIQARRLAAATHSKLLAFSPYRALVEKYQSYQASTQPLTADARADAFVQSFGTELVQKELSEFEIRALLEDGSGRPIGERFDKQVKDALTERIGDSANTADLTAFFDKIEVYVVQLDLADTGAVLPLQAASPVAPDAATATAPAVVPAISAPQSQPVAPAQAPDRVQSFVGLHPQIASRQRDGSLKAILPSDKVLKQLIEDGSKNIPSVRFREVQGLLATAYEARGFTQGEWPAFETAVNARLATLDTRHSLLTWTLSPVGSATVVGLGTGLAVLATHIAFNSLQQPEAAAPAANTQASNGVAIAEPKPEMVAVSPGVAYTNVVRDVFAARGRLQERGVSVIALRTGERDAPTTIILGAYTDMPRDPKQAAAVLAALKTRLEELGTAQAVGPAQRFEIDLTEQPRLPRIRDNGQIR